MYERDAAVTTLMQLRVEIEKLSDIAEVKQLIDARIEALRSAGHLDDIGIVLP